MAYLIDEDTIIAQCTPQGAGALALLRLSGPHAFACADRIAALAGGALCSQQSTHTIHYGHVVDAQGERIDQVLFLLMRAPRTFTGDDTVEITCHNNPFIVSAIIEVACTAGARPALAGEFTQRAVLNGKIDLAQAEGINDLIHAQTALALKKSLAQVEGSLSRWSLVLEQKLLSVLALSEASFEFLDDEGMDFAPQMREQLADALAEIARIRATAHQAQRIREGVRIALVGSVNAGKSSLFNALLGRDRAIVHDRAGTTRDVIEAGLYRNGVHWTLIDTAGIRQAEDVIEQIGIQRSFDEAHLADLVLLVVDHARVMAPAEREVYEALYAQYEQKILVVATKSDMPAVEQVFVEPAAYLTCSVREPTSIAAVQEALCKRVSSLIDAGDTPFLLNQRQYALITSLEERLLALSKRLVPPVAYELISHDLRDTLALLTQVTGKTVSEDAMDKIFRDFCVGK